MENKRQVYLLDPQIFSPETIAVAFAKTSRSPESFMQIASELNEAKSAEFNEKWVVGYGHSSVAEHAVLHIAVENISRLACECLESNRLAAYTEKSTRYQTWDANAFYIPNEFAASPLLLQEYLQTCRHLLDTYQSLIPIVIQHLSKESPLIPDESQTARERRLRSFAIDNCRFLLPSAVLANVGMTINARALEHALIKMLSHPLEEVRRIGTEIKTAAIQAVPTLLKYAEADDFLAASVSSLKLQDLPASSPDSGWCQLIHYDSDAEERILTAYLYRVNNISYAQSLNWVRHASDSEKKLLVNLMLDSKDPHCIPLRELEHATFTFDVQLDQGAYYEVKRHRMMTLTPQNLTVQLGYALPKIITDADQAECYCTAMSEVQATYQRLAQMYPFAAAYVVPNAFNRRFLMTANLRSLIHFIRLRSAPNAHFSVRRLAQCVAQELSSILPTFAPCLPANPAESVASVESTFFSETMKV